jgi:hypothetical protein
MSRTPQTAISPNGGFTFAEHPGVAAPEARIIWRAEVDPGTLSTVAERVDDRHPDRIDPLMLSPWLTVTTDSNAVEHVVLSDGWQRIRLDIERGGFAAGRPVILHYQIAGTTSAEPQLMPLRRLLHLCRHGQFSESLYLKVSRIDRALTVLRVRDAVAAGASQKDIAKALFGCDRVRDDWHSNSDFLRSRVRRMVAHARWMAHGDFWSLLGGTHARSRGSDA